MKVMGIVLAAGQGKRMKSALYKVLHQVCGKPMVGHVLDVLNAVGAQRTVVIVGHGADKVKTYVGENAEYALQEEQLGTGHAVMQARPLLQNEDGTTVVICGDTPLVQAHSLRQMIDMHRKNLAGATVLTAKIEQPHGYGRIIRDGQGHVRRIVEQKDCAPEENKVKEINAGTYCFDNRKLFRALAKVTNNNAQKEYYLTDVIEILRSEGEAVLAYRTEDPTEAIGVNDRVALSDAESVMRKRINLEHMANGVTIIDPQHTYIDKDVQIASDTVIYPGTSLRGSTRIDKACEIGPNADITDSLIGEEVQIKHSVLIQAEIGDRTSVGPYAYLRPGAKIGKEARIGDFVEIKNAIVGKGSKISHLSYVGDAKIGKNVNIGCGAITVNYDGYHKYVTEIEDDAFIGSNVNLIAPVTVGKGAYVVAGSTITNSVGENDLAIARERQTNKTGYAEKLRRRFQSRKPE